MDDGNLAKRPMKVYLTIFLFFLVACEKKEPPMTGKDSFIEVALHAPIKAVLDGSTQPFSQECMKHLKLCWYKFEKSANDKNLPGVTIKNSDSTLVIPKVTSVTIVIDDRVGDNIEGVDISLRGLPDNSTHQQNIDFIYQLIENLLSSGWKHYYFLGDPRISGAEARKVDVPGRVLGEYVSSHPWLDPHYKPDFNQWMKIGAFYDWYFYNNNTYLNLKAWRHDSKDNPAETGTYLITMGFATEREYWVSGFTEDKDKAHWKELLPGELEVSKKRRLRLEKKARAAGIEIDETYQDPPINALRK
ncbi:hypothetical protein [Pseudomonas kitaguniensis]|uniref:hypothetical protein n=1 Tax=Pseudomonas kitaguniensis TaxID=2607908 RepID=UPI003BA0CC77